MLKDIPRTGGGALVRAPAMTSPARVHLMQADVPDTKPEVGLEIYEVRRMEMIEARAMVEAERKPVAPPLDAVDRIRARHHAIARLLAAGATYADIARAVNVTPPTIKNLERSPAFHALKMEYMAMMDKEAIDTRLRLTVLGNVAVDAMTDRILNNPGDVKTPELAQIAQIVLDRTGHGVTTTKNVQINGALSIADIRAIKQSPEILEAEAAEWSEDGGDDQQPAAVAAAKEAEDRAGEGGAGVRAPDQGGGDAALAEGTDLITDVAPLLGRGG